LGRHKSFDDLQMQKVLHAYKGAFATFEISLWKIIKSLVTVDKMHEIPPLNAEKSLADKMKRNRTLHLM